MHRFHELGEGSKVYGLDNQLLPLLRVGRYAAIALNYDVFHQMPCGWTCS